MSILSGYLVNSMGWRWMFIIEGLPAIVWAFFWWKLVDDNLKDADWLSQDEKIALDEKLQFEQQGIKPVKNYGEAFRSKAVILLCLQYALWSIGVYGFVMWLPSIIKGAPGMDIVKTGWLSALPYMFAIIGMFGAAYYSDKSLNRKAYIWPFLLIGSLAFYGSYLAGAQNFWISYVLLIVAGTTMYAPYGPFFAALTELLPRNVTAGAIALINSFGALGSFAGSYLVGYLNGRTGSFGASYLFMAGSLFLSAIITIVVLKSGTDSKYARSNGVDEALSKKILAE
jgi:sugar phosphate permease